MIKYLMEKRMTKREIQALKIINKDVRKKKNTLRYSLNLV